MNEYVGWLKDGEWDGPQKMSIFIYINNNKMQLFHDRIVNRDNLADFRVK